MMFSLARFANFIGSLMRSAVWPIFLLNMSLVVRKPVFGVFDLVPHKAGCAAIEDG